MNGTKLIERKDSGNVVGSGRGCMWNSGGKDIAL